MGRAKFQRDLPSSSSSCPPTAPGFLCLLRLLPPPPAQLFSLGLSFTFSNCEPLDPPGAVTRVCVPRLPQAWYPKIGEHCGASDPAWLQGSRPRHLATLSSILGGGHQGTCPHPRAIYDLVNHSLSTLRLNEGQSPPHTLINHIICFLLAETAWLVTRDQIGVS